MIRSLVLVVAMLAGLGTAQAQQAYALSYVVTIKNAWQDGRIGDCRYGSPCRITIDEHGILLTVQLRSPDDPEGRVSITYRERCCLFAGGFESTTIDARTNVHTLLIFDGPRRRRTGIHIDPPPHGQARLVISPAP